MDVKDFEISILNKNLTILLDVHNKKFSKELSKKNILEISKLIENIYQKKSNNPYFMNSFENFLIELIEKEGIEKVKILFYTLPIKTNIKIKILEDLEEAINTVKLKKELKNLNLTEVIKGAVFS